MLPDEISASQLLIATGKSVNQALKSVRKEIARRKHLVGLAVSSLDKEAQRVRVWQFSDFFDNAVYSQTYRSVCDVFRTSEKFRLSCNDLSMKDIESRLHLLGTERGDITKETAVAVAVSYVLAEIPFCINYASMIKVNSSIMIYHKHLPIGDLLLSGELPITTAKNQGYGVIRVEAS